MIDTMVKSIGIRTKSVIIKKEVNMILIILLPFYNRDTLLFYHSFSLSGFFIVVYIILAKYTFAINNDVKDTLAIK